MRSTTQPADQDPQKGGSYVRQPDGSVGEPVHATAPAKPKLASEAAPVDATVVVQHDDITGQE